VSALEQALLFVPVGDQFTFVVGPGLELPSWLSRLRFMAAGLLGTIPLLTVLWRL